MSPIAVTSREILEAVDSAHGLHTVVEQTPLTASVVLRCSCGQDLVANRGTADLLEISLVDMKKILTDRVPVSMRGKT